MYICYCFCIEQNNHISYLYIYFLTLPSLIFDLETPSVSSGEKQRQVAFLY